MDEVARAMRRGVRRSVALAYVLWHMFAVSPHEVELLPSHHASARIWAQDYGGECAACRAPSRLRDEAILQALRYWRSIIPFEIAGNTRLAVPAD